MKSILKKLSNLFVHTTHIKFIQMIREKGTFKFDFVNFKTKEARSLWVQFTLKDPWFLPHYEKHFGKADIPLAGWLFLYFGISNEGLIYMGDENAKIEGPDGEKYYYASFPNRKAADEYHEQVKKGVNFRILRVIDPDGRSRLVVR